MASKRATERLYRLGAGGRVELAYAQGDEIREGDDGVMSLEAATAARARLVARGGPSPAEAAQAELDSAARASGDTADAKAETEGKAQVEPDEHKARPAPPRLSPKARGRAKPRTRRR